MGGEAAPKIAGRGGQSHFAPRTAENWDSPRRFSYGTTKTARTAHHSGRAGSTAGGEVKYRGRGAAGMLPRIWPALGGRCAILKTSGTPNCEPTMSTRAVRSKPRTETHRVGDGPLLVRGLRKSGTGPGGAPIGSELKSTRSGHGQQRGDQYRLWGVCGFLLLAIGLFYGQTLGHGLLAYDDDGYVYGNPIVTAGLTASGLRWAFSDGPYGEWYPLAMLSHMLDCQLFGLNAWGHHLSNVLLHAAASIGSVSRAAADDRRALAQRWSPRCLPFIRNTSRAWPGWPNGATC